MHFGEDLMEHVGIAREAIVKSIVLSRAHHSTILRKGIELFLSQGTAIHFLRTVEHVPGKLLTHGAIAKVLVGCVVVRVWKSMGVVLELGHRRH